MREQLQGMAMDIDEAKDFWQVQRAKSVTDFGKDE